LCLWRVNQDLCFISLPPIFYPGLFQGTMGCRTPPTTHKRGWGGVLSFCSRGRIANWPKGLVGEPKNSPFFKKTPDSTRVFGKNIGGLYKITSDYFLPALAFCVKAGVSLFPLFSNDPATWRQLNALFLNLKGFSDEESGNPQGCRKFSLTFLRCGIILFSL
jgi:hypothetical protein